MKPTRALEDLILGLSTVAEQLWPTVNPHALVELILYVTRWLPPFVSYICFCSICRE